MISSPPRSTAVPSDDELSALVEAMPVSGPRRSTVLLVTVAAFDSLLFSYDIRVTAGALPYMYMPPAAGGPGLSEFDEGLVGVTLALSAALSAILGGRISDSRGRCFSIPLLAGAFTIAILGCTLSPDIPILLFSHFVLGWAVGGASATVSIYLSESVPTRVRGQLVALDQPTIVFGQLLAHSMNVMPVRGYGGPHVIVDLAIA